MRIIFIVFALLMGLRANASPRENVATYVEWVRTNTIKPDMTNVANSMAANQVTNYNGTNTLGALARLDSVNSNQIDSATFNLATNLPNTTRQMVTDALGYTPPTNTSAGMIAALGYTPPTNSSAALLAIVGYTPMSNTLAAVTNVVGYSIRNCQTNRVTFSGTSVTITWTRPFSTALYAVNVTPLASLGISVVTVYPSAKTTTNCTLTSTLSLSQSFDVMGCE